MSTEHSMTLSDDRHAAVLAALHKHEMAWAVYDCHFQHNQDPTPKEQRAMAQINTIWKELTALGVTVDDEGQLNYPLNEAEHTALKETYTATFTALNSQE